MEPLSAVKTPNAGRYIAKFQSTSSNTLVVRNQILREKSRPANILLFNHASIFPLHYWILIIMTIIIIWCKINRSRIPTFQWLFAKLELFPLQNSYFKSNRHRCLVTQWSSSITLWETAADSKLHSSRGLPAASDLQKECRPQADIRPPIANLQKKMIAVSNL